MEFFKSVIFLVLLTCFKEISCQDQKMTAAELKVKMVEELRMRRQQALDRERDLEIINGNSVTMMVLYDPYTRLKDPRGQPSVLWLTTYAGDPFGFEVVFFALMPLIMAKLIRITKNVFRPNLHLRQGITDFPLVPLIYLQQTKLEQRVKRERRNGIDWLGKKFLIRASDNFVDIKEVHHQPTQKVIPKNPWALLRFMTKFNVVYQHAKHKLEDDAHKAHPKLVKGRGPNPDMRLMLRKIVENSKMKKNGQGGVTSTDDEEAKQSPRGVKFADGASESRSKVDKGRRKSAGARKRSSVHVISEKTDKNRRHSLSKGSLAPSGRGQGLDPEVHDSKKKGQKESQKDQKKRRGPQPDPENPSSPESDE